MRKRRDLGNRPQRSRVREGLGKDRHRRVRGKNAVAVARKDVRTLVLFVSFVLLPRRSAREPNLRAGFDTDAVKLPFRLDSPQWPKLLGTAAASSLATLFVARNFFPTEKKVRHPIRANYGVGDEVFLRTMGHLLGPPLVKANKVTLLENGDQIFPAMLSGNPFGSAYDHV